MSAQLPPPSGPNDQAVKVAAIIASAAVMITLLVLAPEWAAVALFLLSALLLS